MITRAIQLAFHCVCIALAAMAIVLALRDERISDFAIVITGGRVNVIAARDGKIVLTVSNRITNTTPSWRVDCNKTNPLYFAHDKHSAEQERHAAFAGCQLFVGTRALGRYGSADIVELELPLVVLTLPLIVKIARWYRRVCVRSARAERGQCVSCGYDLRGSASDRCSECGAAVTPLATRGAQRAVGEIVPAKS